MLPDIKCEQCGKTLKILSSIPRSPSSKVKSFNQYFFLCKCKNIWQKLIVKKRAKFYLYIMQLQNHPSVSQLGNPQPLAASSIVHVHCAQMRMFADQNKLANLGTLTDLLTRVGVRNTLSNTHLKKKHRPKNWNPLAWCSNLNHSFKLLTPLH